MAPRCSKLNIYNPSFLQLKQQYPLTGWVGEPVSYALTKVYLDMPNASLYRANDLYNEQQLTLGFYHPLPQNQMQMHLNCQKSFFSEDELYIYYFAYAFFL